jgi:uncharacterized protein YpuA (DUF1002 family)
MHEIDKLKAQSSKLKASEVKAVAGELASAGQSPSQIRSPST